MKKLKNLVYVVCLMVVALCFQIYNTNISNIYAESGSVQFTTVSLSNSNFNNNSTSSTLDTSPTGWSKIKTTSTATSGIINVNETKFASQYSSYKLETTQNPGTACTDFDDKVLMINSNSTSSNLAQQSQGYKSESFSLSANTFYIINVWVYTLNSNASIYLNGFEDYETEISTALTNTKFESINTNSAWTEYTFYISTNYQTPSIYLELFLGATSNNTSLGAVFFDNISVIKTSSTYFFDSLNNDNYYKDISMIRNITNTYNFESNGLSDWEMLGTLNEGNVSKIVNVKTKTEMESLGLNYLGSDLTSGNTYALVLSSEDANYLGYSSPAIDINQYGLYKISIKVKCDNISGNVNINLVEQNNVVDFYDEGISEYEPITKTISLNSNTTNNLTNNYSTVSFYVSGHTLFDTSIKLELCLGSESENTSGTVVFDNIIVERIPYSIFENLSTSTNESKVEFTTITGTPSIENGFFNTAHISGATISYPLVAEGWEQTISQNTSTNVFGIVNTNTIKWQNANFGLSNPLNPILKGTTTATETTDTNNILMIYNKTKSYQTITSPLFSVDKSSYYTFSFNYLTNNYNDENSILNVYLVDSNGNILYQDLNVYSKDWTLYKTTIKTEFDSNSLKLVLEVGTAESIVKGYVYIDNVMLEKETYTDTEFANIVNQNQKVLDLSNIGLNLKGEVLNANNLYTALMFTSSLEKGTQYTDSDPIATGGIIDQENDYNITFPAFHTSSIKNMIAISNTSISTYSLTSKQSISLSQGSYYKFSIYIKTALVGTETAEDLLDFGAIFALNGLSGAKITNIKSTDFDKYIIYVYADADTTVQPKFALESNTLNTTGNAFFDTFAFETIEKTEYTSAVNSSNVLVFANTSIPEDNTSSDDTTTSGESVNIWIAISTIIMVIAMIVAMVGYCLRRIEIKKFKVAKQAVYNRDATLVRDVVIKEAEKRKNEELKLLKEEYAVLENYLLELEKDNRERIANQRREHGKGVSRKAEKDFKIFASSRQKIVKDMAKITEKINETNSPEYLLRQEKIIQHEKTIKKE